MVNNLPNIVKPGFLLLKPFQYVSNTLKSKPIIVKSLASGLIFAFGDFINQKCKTINYLVV